MGDTPREIITHALFNYKLGKAGTDKKNTIRPWGIEHTEMRADAVIEALRSEGWGFCRTGPEDG